MKAVSIIIPVYNITKEKLLRCITSIINQTFKDIEIIVVDDGSTNNATEILHSFADEGLLYIINQQNRGVSAARNCGLKKASGQWIMFVDGDDYVESNIISSLLEASDSDTDIIISSCKVKTEKNMINVKFFPEEFEATTLEEKQDMLIQLMCGKYKQNTDFYYTACGVPWGKLYRKSFLDQYELNFDEKLRRMQDNIFNMYAFCKAKKIKYLNKSLYIYDYDHMKKYQQGYDPTVIELYKNILKARESEFYVLGLSDKEILRQYFMNEKLRMLAQLLYKSPLNKKNGITYLQRVKSIKQICNMPEFNSIYTEADKTFAYKHGLKCTVFYLLTRFKFWLILGLLSK